MKRKLVIFCMALLLGLVGIWTPKTEVQAEDWESVDYSFLLTEDALIGLLQGQTRGVYLLTGDSIINKISSTKIGAGGSTTAARRCDVSVLVIIERLSSGSWGRWTSWEVSETNSLSAMAARTYTVPRGYSYRVRCTHYAGTDASSSWTGALKMS